MAQLAGSRPAGIEPLKKGGKIQNTLLYESEKKNCHKKHIQTIEVSHSNYSIWQKLHCR